MPDEPKAKPAGTIPVSVSAGVAFEAGTSVQSDALIPIETVVFRREFIDALALLAKACDEVADKGYERPVLVGGAAVEFHTGSAVASGDFDFVTEEMQVFGEALVALGFKQEDRAGRLIRRGWYHSELTMGVEVVSGPLFDGRSDVRRVQLVEIIEGKSVAVAPIEDMIADRMGQYASGTAPEMLNQAIKLLELADRLDETILISAFARKQAATSI